MTHFSRRTVLAAGAGLVAGASSSAAPSYGAASQRLRIVTYNIYVGSDHDRVRRQLNQLASRHQADVMLLQECSSKSLRNLFGRGHPGWGVFQAGGGDRANSAVLWRRSIASEVLDRGVILDAKDDSNGDFHDRYTAFVQLRMANGARMRFESTHFAPSRFRGHNHEQMRRQHARSIVDRARSLQRRAIPTVFGGDYNYGGDPYNLKGRGNLRMRKDGIDGFYVSGRRVDLVRLRKIGGIKSDSHHPRLLVVDLPG